MHTMIYVLLQLLRIPRPGGRPHGVVADRYLLPCLVLLLEGPLVRHLAFQYVFLLVNKIHEGSMFLICERHPFRFLRHHLLYLSENSKHDKFKKSLCINMATYCMHKCQNTNVDFRLKLYTCQHEYNYITVQLVLRREKLGPSFRTVNSIPQCLLVPSRNRVYRIWLSLDLRPAMQLDCMRNHSPSSPSTC